MVPVAPSARPAKVPLTASAPSLSIRVKVRVEVGVKPPYSDRSRVAPPRVTVPVTLTRSYWPAPVPPISVAKVAPPTRDSAPVLRVPGLAPGASVPPLCTVTAPTVPVPWSVAPLCTVAEAPVRFAFTRSTPAEAVRLVKSPVAPITRIPAPVLVSCSDALPSKPLPMVAVRPEVTL